MTCNANKNKCQDSDNGEEEYSYFNAYIRQNPLLTDKLC